MPRAPILGVVALAFGTAIAFATIYIAGTIADVLIEEGLTKETLMGAGWWALVLLPVAYLGLLMLRKARTSFLPVGWSQDGEVRVEFAAPPRVGRALEGRLWAKRNFQSGETFQLRLWCDRNEVRHVRGRDRADLDHVFFEEKTTVAEGSAPAASLPFQFDVPGDMPVSPPGSRERAFAPRWFLELVVPRSRFGANPQIDFDMGPAT